MEKIIIGMTGKAGAGKDTVGDYLCDNYGFQRVAFANPLKQGIKEMFMLTEEQITDRIIREQPLEYFPEWSPRKLFQFFGTELLRENFDDKIWIKLFHKTINNIQGDRIIVTDCRFPNEAKELKGMNDVQSHIVKVVRPDCIGTNVGLSNHASESHDIQSDIVLSNDETIEDLYSKVDKMIRKIL
jgi:hypothetical protein